MTRGHLEGPPEDVYPPREDSALLLPFARVRPGATLLEVCCGAGVAALEAARSKARVVATDLNPHALRHLRDQARAEGLSVEAVRTDLARGLGRFDVVLANPPYLPTLPDQRDPDRWHDLAVDGGPDGCRVTSRLLAELPLHLVPGGDAFLIVSSLQEPGALASIRDRWTSRGGTHAIVATRAYEGERLSVWKLGFRPEPARA